jgi:menaquinone-specific isochorismate synthase
VTQPDVALRLRARTEPVREPLVLLDHLGRDGCAWIDGDVGFTTAGVVATVAPDDAVEFLATIQHDLHRDAARVAGPRAVGALPFAGTGRLIVPARIVGRDADGRGWCTTIDAPAPPPELHLAPPAPTSFTVAATSTELQWQRAVEAVLARINSSVVEKVVLARAVTVDADRPFVVRDVLARLHATQPNCVVYADGGFVGASPELLVRRRGDSVVCRPLAGTGPSAGALFESEKDQREHQLVVDAVVDTLAAHCDVVHANRPAPLELTDVAHLATTVTARARHATAVDLARALHPTPAVAGTPRDIALAMIGELESVPRGCYAGPFGWVDGRGDGEFIVSLRGAAIDGAHATLHAGAGIVAGSDAHTEWAETRAKLRPMLAALVAP